jgi:hypothetical protein
MAKFDGSSSSETGTLLFQKMNLANDKILPGISARPIARKSVVYIVFV